MKLLFDENVSPKLVDHLSAEFPGSEHVRNVGLTAAEDQQVWEYAREHGFAAVQVVCYSARSASTGSILVILRAGR